MADDKELKVTIRYNTDTRGAEEALKKNQQLKEGIDRTSNSTKDSAKALAEMGKTADQLQKVGMVLTAIGGAGTAAIAKSISNYISAVGSTEGTSKAWLNTSNQIQEANVRIGRSLTQAVLPAYQNIAGVVDKIAEFSEKNPEAVKAGVGVVGAATAGGTALLGASQMLRALKAMGVTLPTASSLGLGANAAAWLPAVGYGLSGAAGIGLGDMISRAMGNMGLGEFMGKGIAIAGGGLTSLLTGDQEKGRQAFLSLAQALGQLTNNANTASAAVKKVELGGMQPNQVIAYAQYQRQEEQAARAHYIQMAIMQRDFNRQQEQEQQDFDRQRTRELRDFNLQMLYSEQDYNRQRTISARDYGIESVRAEEDYQRARKRAQEDLQYSMWDIMRSGDALAYMKAMHDYNVQQSRAAEDYTISRRRRKEDYDLQLKDQQEQYQIQRKRQLEQFNIRIKDEDQDYKIRRERELLAYKTAKDDAERQYKEEQRMRKQALIDALNDMADGTEKAKKYFQSMTNDMVDNMKTLAEDAAQLKDLYRGLDNPNIPTRDSGGYMQSGRTYRNASGAREFVIGPQGTALLEQSRGALSQDSVLSALVRSTSGGSTGTTLIWNDHRTFSSDLTPSQMNVIRQQTDGQLQEMMQDVR